MGCGGLFTEGSKLAIGGVRQRIIYPTRLETRTKESNLCASHWEMRKPIGEVKANLVRSVSDLLCERWQRIIVTCHIGFGCRRADRAHRLGPERW